jgi:hypothetical protein
MGASPAVQPTRVACPYCAKPVAVKAGVIARHNDPRGFECPAHRNSK